MADNRLTSKKRNLLPWGRLIFFALATLLQFVLIFLAIFRLSAATPIIYLFFLGVSMVCAILAWNSRINATYKMAWIFIICLFPLFGGILFLFANAPKNNRLGFRRLSYDCNQLKNQLFAQEQAVCQSIETLDIPLPIKRLIRHIQTASNYPLYFDTPCTYFASGEQQFRALFEDLKQAKRFIFIESFILSDGLLWQSLCQILTERAQEGVQIRLIYDDIGSLWHAPKSDLKRLETYGVEIMVFNPLRMTPTFIVNQRDHRKLVIIDGDIAYTGGSNIADEYVNVIDRFGHWKDSGLKVCGAAVWNFTVMFLNFWHHITKTPIQQSKTDFFYRPQEAPHPPHKQSAMILPFDDIPDDDQEVSASVYRNLINRANQSIQIMTPYLILDESFLKAIYTAAESGVQVTIITPHHPDKPYVHAVTRSYYKNLVAHGVQIYEYEPGFIHSKVLLVDHELAVVGTINFDYRSLYLHMECAVWLYRSPCILQIEDDFKKTLQVCRKISQEDCNHRLPRRIGNWFLRLFAPLM